MREKKLVNSSVDGTGRRNSVRERHLPHPARAVRWVRTDLRSRSFTLYRNIPCIRLANPKAIFAVGLRTWKPKSKFDLQESLCTYSIGHKYFKIGQLKACGRWVATAARSRCALRVCSGSPSPQRGR